MGVPRQADRTKCKQDKMQTGQKANRTKCNRAGFLTLTAPCFPHGVAPCIASQVEEAAPSPQETATNARACQECHPEMGDIPRVGRDRGLAQARLPLSVAIMTLNCHRVNPLPTCPQIATSRATVQCAPSPGRPWMPDGDCLHLAEMTVAVNARLTFAIDCRKYIMEAPTSPAGQMSLIIMAMGRLHCWPDCHGAGPERTSNRSWAAGPQWARHSDDSVITGRLQDGLGAATAEGNLTLARFN